MGITHVKTGEFEQKNLWLKIHYHSILQKIAEKKEITARTASLRFGELNLVMRDNIEYQYCDQFGLVKV